MNETAKITYVTVEASRESPPVRGFDLFVCTWVDVASIVHTYLDGLGENKSVTLIFTIREWTNHEYEMWCKENNVEIQ
jgi:hypothetical protein